MAERSANDAGLNAGIQACENHLPAAADDVDGSAVADAAEVFQSRLQTDTHYR